MKLYALAPLWLVLTLLMSACTKDDAPQKQQAAFPANTEWTGTMHLVGWRYDQPCNLRIHGDNTVTLYSLFAFFIDNDIVNKDSLAGTILQTDHAGNLTRVTISFPDLPNIEQNTTIVIQDQQTLEYQSSTGNFALHLTKFPEQGTSVQGRWSGPVMHGGPLEGFHAYPDLSSIDFGVDGTTTYGRNGSLAEIKNPQSGEFTIIRAPYKQDGANVWMDGYNEMNGKLVLYFGVLMPDGQGMWVDSRNSAEGRLPSYLATIDWNGPKGVTPVIHRQ